MAQLMPLPLTVSCFIKMQIGFTFLVPADLGRPGKRAVKRVCVCVRARARARACTVSFSFCGDSVICTEASNGPSMQQASTIHNDRHFLQRLCDVSVQVLWHCRRHASWYHRELVSAAPSPSPRPSCTLKWTRTTPGTRSLIRKCVPVVVSPKLAFCR